jgi:hypothetical protein
MLDQFITSLLQLARTVKSRGGEAGVALDAALPAVNTQAVE